MTHEETILSILMQADYPMRCRDLIKKIQEMKPLVAPGTIRQVVMTACRKKLLGKVSIEGFRITYYGLPQWFDDNKLYPRYTKKIYESKQIQVQQPNNRLGRTA